MVTGKLFRPFSPVGVHTPTRNLDRRREILSDQEITFEAMYAGMPRGIDANTLLSEVLEEDPQREAAEGFFYRFPREV